MADTMAGALFIHAATAAPGSIACKRKGERPLRHRCTESDEAEKEYLSMALAAACPAAIARGSGVVRWVLEPSAVQTASLGSLSVAVSSLTAVLIAYIGDLPQPSLAGGLRTVSSARYFECSACRAAWRAGIRRVLSFGAHVLSCGPFSAHR